MGCFGQSGLQRKLIHTAISMLLLRSIFYFFMGKTNEILKICIVASALKSCISDISFTKKKNLWSFKFICNYIDLLNKSLLATTVGSPFNSLGKYIVIS
jgi:hypothetical protein